MRIDVFNGPNLNLLGQREPSVYGTMTLPALELALVERGEALGVRVVCCQHNGEGALVDAIQGAAAAGSAGALVNAGGYTHTSVAIRDALTGTTLPFVEVHLSNIHAREPFRHRSLLSDVALGVIVGLGPAGYLLGLDGLVARLSERLP